MKYPLRKIGPAETVVEHNEVKSNQQNKSHRKNFLKKNKENASNLMRTKDGLAKENGGYYTLTHKQLNAILQSVGKIASLRGEGVNIAIGKLTFVLSLLPEPLTTSLIYAAILWRISLSLCNVHMLKESSHLMLAPLCMKNSNQVILINMYTVT